MASEYKVQLQKERDQRLTLESQLQ